jgi:hypothetical protein
MASALGARDITPVFLLNKNTSLNNKAGYFSDTGEILGG